MSMMFDWQAMVIEENMKNLTEEKRKMAQLSLELMRLNDQFTDEVSEHAEEWGVDNIDSNAGIITAFFLMVYAWETAENEEYRKLAESYMNKFVDVIKESGEIGRKLDDEVGKIAKVIHDAYYYEEESEE